MLCSMRRARELGIFLFIVWQTEAASVLFEDSFSGKLDPEWSWIRENPKGWRITPSGLQVLVEPGNMWGPSNNAKNVLVRPAPPLPGTAIAISVTISNQPTSQYEQVDLVWYYDDSHMVKIGQEMVDGQLSIVMGREGKDRTRTIAIVPLDSLIVSVRYLVRTNELRGQFRTPKDKHWRDAGITDWPAPPDGKPKISLQFYQGATNAAHWAVVSDFRIEQIP